MARLLFIGLWNFCDDAGRHKAHIKRLKMEVFPGDDFESKDIQKWIDQLIKEGLIVRYEVGNEQYWEVTGWKKHQRIDQPTYRHPDRKGVVPDSPNKRRMRTAHSPLEGNGRESKEMDLDKDE
ncbi:MAG: hypothetical protein JW937_01205 [Candidatus Omnitrophica bacterium]|nr:hypothetical protein [Candidatus Omnitrophota bacterium]